MSKLTRWPLLLTLLLGTAGADRTAAPTPLYPSPALSGKPALTLPAGKPLSVVASLPDDVSAVAYGEGLYYVRTGLIDRREQDALAFQDDRQWFIPPQQSGEPVTLPLTWEGQGTAPRDWQVRALPLAEPTLGQPEVGRVTGRPVTTVQAQLTRQSQRQRPQGEARLGRLKPGLYLVTASRLDASAAVLGAVVVRVTDLNLVSVATPGRVRVWATRLGSGAPVPNVQLSALAVKYDWQDGSRVVSRRTLAPVRTDAQGLATFALRDGEQLSVRGQVTLGGQPHSAQLGRTENELWTGVAERARALIQTDKPVYRPGETLRGFAVLRRLGAGTRLPYTGPVTVRLRAGYPDATLAQLTVKPDADGLVRFSLPLPQDVKTGGYSLEVELPAAPSASNPNPEPDVSQVPVEVRAFVKPLFTLDLSGPQEVVSGAPLTLSARGELYQGGPANVQAEAFMVDGYASDELYPDYDAGDDKLRYQEVNYEAVYGGNAAPDIDPKRRPDQTLTLRGGLATLPLTLQAKNGQPTRYDVALRARDEYGRDVWASRPVTVYPAAVKFVQPSVEGAEHRRVSVAVQQVGSGKALAGRRVQAEVVRVFYVTQPDGKSVRREQRISQSVLTSDAAGRVALNVTLTPGQEGGYVARLSTQDSAGRTARASVEIGSVYKSGAERQAPTLVLTPERSRYQPGDTARLTLKTDLPVGTPLLLSVNAEDRGQVKLIQVTGPTMTLTWPVTAALGPAFSVSAVAVRGGETVQASSGDVLVPRLDQQLDVQVTAAGEVTPGAEVTFTVRTSRGGQPTSALVTLAAVHESVYAVVGDPTPNPWRFLWGATPPQFEIRSSSSQADDGRGGGGGSEAVFYRSDLREVAAFQAVRTDAQGTAKVTVRMPEGLGSYRLSARAFTRTGAAGEARGEQRVGLPFAVRLIRPRVLTVGDTGSVAVSAADRTGQGGNVTLTLGANGQTQTANLPLQGGSATRLFSVKAPQDAQALILTASAQRGANGERDGLRETVPVRPAGARQLLSGSGSVGAGKAGGSANASLKWPQGARPESLTLDLAATPLQLALTGLDAALADPADRWVTTDALSARLSSNLDLAALAGPFGWPEVRTRALAQARRDLTSLLALRGSDGWGWTEGSPASAEMTARALDALVQAKGAGLTDAVTLQVVRQQAELLLKKSPNSPVLAAALARAGAPAAALRLARAGMNDPAEAARLATVLAGTQPQLAGTLYDRARRAARSDKDGALVLGDAASWRGDSEPTALLLGAAARLGRTSDVPALTRAVLELRTGSSWGGPVATAAAVQALRTLAAREGTPAPRQVTVRLGTFQQTLTVSAPTRLLIPAAKVQPGALSVQSSGPLAYVWELRVRRSGNAPQGLSPLKIERQYDKVTVNRDGIVTVTLTLKTPVRLTHLRVTDPLPGGLEAVDDRPFDEPAWVNAAGSGHAVWADRSLYDDRAVFYLEQVRPGTTTIKYRLRALASGQYRAPAPRVDFVSGAAPAEGAEQQVTVQGGQ